MCELFGLEEVICHTAHALYNALSLPVIFSLDCWKHNYMTLDKKNLSSFLCFCLIGDDLESAEIEEELREYCRVDNARHLKERLGSFVDGVWHATTQLQDYIVGNEYLFSRYSSTLLVRLPISKHYFH